MRPVWAIAAAVLVLALAGLPASAAADLSPIPRPHEWIPNGSVEAVALDDSYAEFLTLPAYEVIR